MDEHFLRPLHHMEVLLHAHHLMQLMSEHPARQKMKLKYMMSQKSA
jgi:hypothetical protein